MSFDNIDKRFEYVRYGGSWPLLVDNILKIKKLCKQGQWGGIHAVYNIYNATRLTELVDWAKHIGVDTHWQSLYQPDYLDPLKHSQQIRDLAQVELEKVLARADLTDSERSFFDQAYQNYQQPSTVDLALEFKIHIQEIEQQYHPDQQGKFAELWPEFGNLL